MRVDAFVVLVLMAVFAGTATHAVAACVGAPDGVIQVGEECDDNNPWVFDGCSECTLDTGTVRITEIMQDPTVVADEFGEWFEVYNPTGHPMDMGGWTIRNETGAQFVVAGPFIVHAGEHAVFGREGRYWINGNVDVYYEYGDALTLSNGKGGLVLIDPNGTYVDYIIWYSDGGWPSSRAGQSLQFGGEYSSFATSRNSGALWCHATSAMPNGENGTPAEANDPCGVEVCGDAVVNGNEECDDGNTTSRDGCDASCAWEAICGNGIVEGFEQCDNGAGNGDNVVAHGACDTYCTHRFAESLSGHWNYSGSFAEGSEDFLVFEAQTRTRLEVEFDNCPAGTYLDWYSGSAFGQGPWATLSACEPLSILVDAGLHIVIVRNPSTVASYTISANLVFPAKIGQNYVGDLNTLGREDHFSFSLDAPTDVSLQTLGCGAGGRLDPELVLFQDNDGAWVEVDRNDDDNNRCSKIDALLPAGDYEVVVRAGGNDGRSVGEYTLSLATAGCGNGWVGGDDEVCDDGNTETGDGCDAACQIEGVCGDGIVDPVEECDDGNAVRFDGCTFCKGDRTVIINEIMQDPIGTDFKREWFELYNPTPVEVELAGTEIRSTGGGYHRVTGLVVPAYGYVVLGGYTHPDINGGVPVDYGYGQDLSLSDQAGALQLIPRHPRPLDDIVRWDTGVAWPNPAGQGDSMQFGEDLDPFATDNNDGANWCRRDPADPASVPATPGQPNIGCGM